MKTRKRGRKKQTLRDLSRIKPTNEEANEILDELIGGQKPIVTAILGQASIEIELDDLLRSRFARQDDETWATLIDENGPLATFYNKIIAAYAFKIFDETIRDALNTVRHIRNAFAHTKINLDFSHELIVKELATISLPAEKPKWLYRDLLKVREAAVDPTDGPQNAYIGLCITLSTLLLRKYNRQLRAKTKRLEKRYHQQLMKALMATQSNVSSSAPRSFLANLIADPNTLNLGQAPEKPAQSDTKPGQKKGRT